MDDDRSSDTQETFGNQSLPGSVSGQNTEEGPGPGEDSDSPDRAERDPSDEDTGREDRSQEAGRPGGAGEHSQATGDPDSAG